ncbi:MAG: hypothetical protein GY844_06020 [Bradyrhizobium sp.]|nr:hypothetical protein [Bradyrhizobium sp.]
MDSRAQAEAVIEARVRESIEQTGGMPDGKSLEWHGADVEAFSRDVLRVLASGSPWDEQLAAIRAARDTHIIEQIARVEIDLLGADLADDFATDDRLARARLADFQRYGVAA